MFRGFRTHSNFNGLNRAGSMKTGSSERYFQPGRVSFYIYKLNSRDSCPIYGASAVRVFLLLFSFSIFSDRRRSLKIENENNSMLLFYCL